MSARWQVESIDNWPDSMGSHVLDTTDEPLGTKEKFWVTASDRQSYLFKYARHHGDQVMGEDWVEWAVHELAKLLSIPTAVAIPALHNGRRGVLSRSILPVGARLVHGNELLAAADPAYDMAASRENPGYTVPAVLTALEHVGAPDGCVPPIRTAFDAWAGYVLLDAWVAGRDRHHENWAVIEQVGRLQLAPSFDHGNALGFQELEDNVSRLASSPSKLASWVRRGLSHHFAGKPPLTQIANDALSLAGSGVREHWLARLDQLAVADVESVLREVPADYLSDSRHKFVAQLLRVNQGRILNGD